MAINEMLTMSKSDLEEVIWAVIGEYDKTIREKVSSEVFKAVRHSEASIFCMYCGNNIKYTKEPSIFGTPDSNKYKNSGVYHMECWKKAGEE